MALTAAPAAVKANKAAVITAVKQKEKLAAHFISGILFGTPNGVTASRPGSEANLLLAFCQFDADA